MAKKKRKSTVPKNETASEKFVRLANFRVNAVLKKLQGVRNLAGSQYESTPEQQAKILTALRSEIDGIEAVFSKTVPEKETFAL
jgi:hypothetical protein